MSYVADYLLKSTNYTVVNIDNIYKLHIMTLDMLTDAQKFRYLENLKLQVGVTHHNDFKMYIFRKFPNHELLEYFKT